MTRRNPLPVPGSARPPRRWRHAARIALAVLLGIVLLGWWNRAELQRLHATVSLFDEANIVDNFVAMDRLFFNAPLPVGVAGADLRQCMQPLPLADSGGFARWLDERRVTGLVVLKDGSLVHEQYRLGTDADDRRISWSVAKSFLSALVGIAVAEGHIASLDDPVTRHAPALAGSAYDGVTLRQVLQMSSGVRFDEDYFDFFSDINRMGRVLALGQSMDAFAVGLQERAGPPGERWRYVSIDTHVIGMVLRGATGRGIGELMAEKLLTPIGVQSAPYYLTDGDGVAFVLGGLNMSTRDYARFGQLMLQRGTWNGRQVVPSDWVDESTRPSANTAPGRSRYGYQWWIPEDAVDGEFLARGVYGQFVYINRPAGVVIAMNSADRAFARDGVYAQTVATFRDIAAALASAPGCAAAPPASVAA